MVHFLVLLLLSSISTALSQPSLNLSQPRLAVAVRQVQSSWTRYRRQGKNIEQTSFFSEEGNGYSGRQTAPIAGITCSERYCDNKSLLVVRDGTSKPVLNSAHWTRSFTDGDRNFASCPDDMLVNELHCHGRYCDDIRLQCGRLAKDYRVNTGDLRDVGWFSEEQGERLCPDGYYLWAMACKGRFCDDIKMTCALVEYIPQSTPSLINIAWNYAPIYFFDSNGPEHCLPDWPSSHHDGTCRTSFLDNTPSFFEHAACGEHQVFTYWLWYGLQKGCRVIVRVDDGHGNDWEHVSVFVRGGIVEKVVYHQHSGHYTRRRDTFERTGERPHVYIGKVSHGSYHARCDGVCGVSDLFKGCFGSVNYCVGGCPYWDDFRNPGPRLSSYNLHDLQAGKTIDGIVRPDRPVCIASCSGASTRLPVTSGCWQNEDL